AKLASVTKADLDKQVSAGKLTQQQEDVILQRLQTAPLPLWDQPLKRPRAPGAPAQPPRPQTGSTCSSIGPPNRCLDGPRAYLSHGGASRPHSPSGHRP